MTADAMGNDTPTTEQVRLAATSDCDWLDRSAFDRWLVARDRLVRARALRDAVRDMRAARRGNWNLPDPLDPEVAYSVDRWLEVRADRIEKDSDYPIQERSS